VLAANARPADAQIFSWVDENGSLVVSNVAQGTNLGIPSYDVPESDGIRATRYVAAEKSRSFDDLIDEHATRNGVRRDLVRAVIQVESAFNPRAVSNKGAMGLMQLMPATARQFGVVNAFDPDQNVRGGVAYLRQLLDRYDGNERLALAAYNAGPGAVDNVSRVNGLAGTSSGSPSSPRSRIYRVVEIIDGREIVKYTDQDPNER
jgi:soluble lytic murein transglycosylase-like protein